VWATATLFQAKVRTSALAEKTQLLYHWLWPEFVMYDLVQLSLQAVMPATKEMLHAQAMMMLGASQSLIRMSIWAI
jgi:hypothetical protein